MFRSTLCRSAARLTIATNAVRCTPVLPLLVARRYKSSDAVSEIRTQLPAMDEVSSASNIDPSTILESTVESTSSILSDPTVITGLSNHIGYLNEIGLAQSWIWPSGLIQHLLEMTHVYAGLPWWGSICAVTLLVRLVLFPLYIKSTDASARNSKISPQLTAIDKKLRASKTMTEKQTLAMERRQLMVDNGIKYRWLLAPTIQLPLAIGFFNAIRGMANYPVEGFSYQGLGWFMDLTQADPYLGLQCITAATLLGVTKLSEDVALQQGNSVTKKMMKILPLISIPATMKLSSAVVLYFSVNALLSVLQSMLLRNKSVRKYFNIAEMVHHPTVEKDKGIIASFKDTFENAKTDAIAKAEMNNQEKEMFEKIKQEKINSRIKLTSRSDFDRKKKGF